VFGAIALDPYLVADDIDVDKTSVDSFSRIFTDNHQEVMVGRTIEDSLRFDVAICVRDSGVFSERFFDYLTIEGSGVHCEMVSLSGW